MIKITHYFVHYLDIIWNKEYKQEKGFIATTSIIILSFSAIIVTIIIYTSIMIYADSVYRQSMRMQAIYNLETCINYAKMYVRRDNFVRRTVYIKDLGCTLHISSNPNIDSPTYLYNTGPVYVWAESVIPYKGDQIKVSTSTLIIF